MKLPFFVIDEIKQNITSEFKVIYDRFLKDSEEMEFEQYLKITSENIIEEIEHWNEVTTETLYPVQKRRQETKKRWVKKELEQNARTGFYHEIDVIAKGLYEQLLETDLSKFKLLYECDSYEELREKKIEELQHWAKDEDKPVCHYPYIKYKRNSQIVRSILDDIKFIVIKTLKDTCPLGEQSAFYSRPLSLTTQPIDPFNKSKIEPSSTVKLENGEFYVDTYYIDDETVFESYLNVESLQEGLMKESLKILNEKDAQILSYIMSIADEDFYKRKELIIEIGDIVRNVYGTDSKKNYMAVKESLIKMKHIHQTAIDSAKRNITIRLLHNADIYVSSDTNKEVVRIVASNELVTQYIKNQTVNMYKHSIDDFKLNTSRVLIYPLQRERIACASGIEPGEELIFKANIKFFRGVLYFGNKRRAQQIKIINEALEEIKNNNITLKDWDLIGDTYTLRFHPISERERNDLLKNIHPQAFLQESSIAQQLEMNV